MDNQKQLHFFFLPMPAPGHIIPMASFARLIAKRGVRSTIVVTPGNIRYVDDSSIEIMTIPFPDVGLPEGIESTVDIPSGMDGQLRMARAMSLLQKPFEDLLRAHRPHCAVSDWAFVWPPLAAVSLGVPHVTFRSSCAFTACVMEHAFYSEAPSSDIPSLVGLPHRVLELEESELPLFRRQWVERFCMPAEEAERSSIGVVIDTFRELEGEYVALLEKTKRMWCPGPLHLHENNSSDVDDSWRISDRIKKWLDSNESGSVLYVCFGSMWDFGEDQLREIAAGLEDSGNPYLWVVRSISPGGIPFPGERGMVVTEWVPQVPILNHPAVGGFMSHAGGNSALEAVGAGKPMILWPLYADQFFNERLYADVLGVGVRVLEGDERVMDLTKKKLVSRAKVTEAVATLFGVGEEGKEMRRKATEYGKMARLAVEEGGSSYTDLTCLINEVSRLAETRTNWFPSEDRSITTTTAADDH